jgi:hypothetical protein
MNAPTVVALDEQSHIYVVVDENGRTIGTGTKEVCEVLAEMVIRPPVPAPRNALNQVVRPYNENIRSAIKI